MNIKHKSTLENFEKILKQIIMKSRDGKPDLYIPIVNGIKEGSMQLISIKGMLAVRNFVPKTKQIMDNLRFQRDLVERDPSYKPMPIRVKIGEEDFNECLLEVRKKYPSYDFNKIPMQGQSDAKSVVIIERV